MTEPHRKLREIERLRGVAVLMTAVFHCDAITRRLLPHVWQQMWSGVDLFFVISGFVVTLSLGRLLPFLEEAPDFLWAFRASSDALRTFYARRFFRILPAALAMLVLDRILVLFDPTRFGTPSDLLRETIAFLGGLYNYIFPFHPEYRFGIFWSLAVEEHFYLLLPMLFVVFRTTKRRLAVATILGCASMAARGLPARHGYELSYLHNSSHLRFDSLMAGVVLALLAEKTREGAPILPRGLMRFLILPTCIVLLACLPGVAPPEVCLHEGLVVLWLLSAVLVGFAAKGEGYVLSFPVLATLLEYAGSRSYALYLCHITAFRFEEMLGERWPLYRALVPSRGAAGVWRQPLLQLAVAIVVAEAIHRTVERPFVSLGRIATDPLRRSTFALPRSAKVGSAIALCVVVLFWLLAIIPKRVARTMWGDHDEARIAVTSHSDHERAGRSRRYAASADAVKRSSADAA